MERTGISYFYAGAMALVLSWAMLSLTGCRLRNAVEYKQETEGFELLGRYAAEADSVQFCAKHSGAQSCATLDSGNSTDVPAQVPVLAQSLMSDPVYLWKSRSDPQWGAIQSSENGSNLPVALLEQGGLYLWVENRHYKLAGPFFPTEPTATSCKLILSAEGSGVRGPARNGLEGSLDFDLVFRIVFQNESGTTGCRDFLQDMVDCALDQTTCGGAKPTDNAALQFQALDRFEPYIEAGILTWAQVPNLTELAYTIGYR